VPLAPCRLEEGSNALVLPAKADRPTEGGGDAAAAAAAAPEKRLSKSQQRKLKKIQEEKEKRAKRADVMQALAQHQVRA
jgi:ATP-dependent RNA helicase DHX37/DHR1